MTTLCDFSKLEGPLRNFVPYKREGSTGRDRIKHRAKGGRFAYLGEVVMYPKRNNGELYYFNGVVVFRSTMPSEVHAAYEEAMDSILAAAEFNRMRLQP